MKQLKYIIVFFLSCLLKNSFSQHPAYYQINDEQNLPSNEVYRVVQDEFGYIWLGSDAGLYRYDGFNFKSYVNSQQNGRAISFLQIDKKQRVWGKNFFGQIYRVEGDSLRIIKSYKTSNASYPQFTLDNDCNLWVYKDSYIIKYNDLGDSISSYQINLKSKEEIVSLYFDGGHIYAFSSNVSLYKLNINTAHLLKLQSFNREFSESKNCMFVKHKGKLLLLVKFSGLYSDFVIYEVGKTVVISFYKIKKLENNQNVYSLYSDNERLWITGSFGVIQIDPINSVTKTDLFSSDKISYMLKDREGMYWFSSLINGLFVVPSIQVMQLNSGNSLIKENNITSIKAVSESQILCGSYLGNIYDYNRQTASVKEDYANKTEYIASVKQISQYKNYTFISRGKFCVIDNKTGKQNFPKISNVRDFEVVNDTIYMVIPEFILKISVLDLFKNDQNYIKINNSGGKAVEYNSQNHTLYFVLGNGTFMYDLKGNWTELKVKGESVIANSISYDNNLLWVSTVTSGIYGFENNQLKYHYNEDNYLTENTTRFIKAFDKHIWFTTDNYLYNIDYSLSLVSKYDVTQSIRAKDINAIDIFKGNVYLATKKGLIYFTNKLSSLNTVTPNIKITEVSLNNQAIDYSKELALSYNHKNLKINFSSVALKSKGKFKYQYRLIGLDTNWITVSPTTPFVLFSKMPAGDFSFELRSMNENNIFSKTIILPITVSFPFWNRWWFIVLMMVLVSGIVAFLFTLRIRFIKRRADLRNKVTASQLTALKSQMNPHFLFNTLNSLQDLILKHDIKNSNFYLNKFSLLMREILDVSGKDEIILSREIKMLDTYLELEKLRFGDDFNYCISVSDELDDDHIKLPPMIIQPFIENALKHGLLHKKGTKKLSIDFKLYDQVLQCVIIDNGVGRKRSEEIKLRNKSTHESFATQATEKRMDLLNSFNDKEYSFGIIDLIKDDVAEGTEVVISIPI